MESNVTKLICEDIHRRKLEVVQGFEEMELETGDSESN
jgi:hypothetical protein